MKRNKFFPVLIGLTLMLAACTMPARTPTQSLPATFTPPATSKPPETVTVVVITATATVTPTNPPTNTPTDTPTPFPVTSVTSGGTGACLNSAEFVTDVSFPDGSFIKDSTSFVKTWRVKNTGSCTWDSRYELVFVDGTLLLNADHAPLPGTVGPGQSVDLSLGMTSPIYPGAYESDWKLRSPSGFLFGVGKKDSPLWLKIVVGSSSSGGISGFIYQDLNANHRYDLNEILMANREVWLQQGSCEQGAGAKLASALSDSNGRYILIGQTNTTYCVGLTGPLGMEDSLTVNMTNGQGVMTADLRAAIPNGVISGLVWNDSAQPDGLQQASEAPLAGVAVVLQLGSCANPVSVVPVATNTDASGHFAFNSLSAGTYCVSIRPTEAGNPAILQNGEWTTPLGGAQELSISHGSMDGFDFGWKYK